MSSENGRLSIEKLEELVVSGIVAVRERWMGTFIVPDGLLNAFRKAVVTFTESASEAPYRSELDRLASDLVGHQHRFFLGQHMSLKGEVRSGQPYDQPRKGQIDRLLGTFTQYVREEGGRHRFEEAIDEAARLLHQAQMTLRPMIAEQKTINAERAAEAERQRKARRVCRTHALLKRVGIGTPDDEDDKEVSEAESAVEPASEASSSAV